MKQVKKIANKKENKKEEKIKLKNVTVNEDNEMEKLVKIVGIILVIVLVFLGITYLVTREPKNNEEEPTTIQYTEILVGEILKKSGTYHVLVGHAEDKYLSLYKSYLDSYKSKNASVPYYIVNLDSVFNKNYVAEQSNLYTSDMADIRFKDATLLKIEDARIVSAYEGLEQIENYLSNLVK